MNSTLNVKRQFETCPCKKSFSLIKKTALSCKKTTNKHFVWIWRNSEFRSICDHLMCSLHNFIISYRFFSTLHCSLAQVCLEQDLNKIPDREYLGFSKHFILKAFCFESISKQFLRLFQDLQIALEITLK